MKLLAFLFSRELILLGLTDLRAHKLRSFLTALGMIFGVGAVICMLSIGEGASAEQLESIRLLGSNNIILRSMEPASSQQASEAQTRVQRYGLKVDDVHRLRELRGINDIVLMREVADVMTHVSYKLDGSVLGTTPNFFDVVEVPLARGRELKPIDEARHKKVCVIGAGIAEALFPNEDPLGRNINVISRSTGPVPYRVVGVLANVQTAGSPAKGLGSRDINRDMYIPLATADLRYGDLKYKRTSGSREIKEVQFSDIYVNVAETEWVLPVSQMVQRVLEHGHRDQDYSVTVPLELLQQAERTKQLWQTVLGSIAGISLLVGGIGIMNIMLASVTERTREIGIRRALGAKRHHITAQFLVETVILSIAGGLIGIVLGVGFAWLIDFWFEDFRTIVPPWGVILSFAVSAAVGITFGLYPARSAARLDPIQALNATTQA
jgi:putative ABC transport system permease protein